MSSVWPAADDPRAKLFNDQVHGYIKVNGLCVSLMDTPQFQRLRDLKQLGTLYYVFPGASHNRFEHSLGVSFLSGQTVERFRQQQPELELTQRDARLLSAAGLLHDLGHGPFSHVFEHEFMPRVAAARGYGSADAPTYHHEDMSLRMIEYMVDDNNIDMERDDVRFIQQLIVGAKETHMGSRVDSRGYLYEIVANGRNCIDVDKFDYLARDMLNLFGLRKVFDFSRLTMFNRVIGNEICYHTSVNLDIYDMFQQRYQMHKQIYNHRKGKAVEFMICDAMLLADKELGICASTQTPEDFQFLTDHIVHSIEASKTDTLADARALLKRMRRRELYEFIDEYLLPPELMSRIPRFTSEELATQTSYDGVTLDPEDIIVSDGRLNYNFKDRNPVDNVSFYASSDLNAKFHIPKEQVSLLFPEKFEERIIRVYSRNKSPKVHAAIHHAFRSYIRQFSTTLPPPSPSSKIYGKQISQHHAQASKRKTARKLPVLAEADTENEANGDSPAVSSPVTKRLKPDTDKNQLP
ncbi:Deoxynucleoside triphosphate triphosphohydrolase [Phytophthora fragariae]|uniref:Deoxynucleoside triphosphate triphosphohydrolase n=1 Tax=Phytophthora fragariae TaxID=53985 RepID=A0A6A3E3S9_9STRA|nr:Deoxynucleoside triphosphate triphosphohydrolase [Phytophthora fragariae]KAE8928519.1 Deoxynucleoside triphosphate triphosphohydrolase [Phytophthora fragariae]KAE8993910.1 Deoxynucleoside triphosphate triphosphohydrolase [Phytophthora fragariae]KAE9087990.1 Deoxynucleoside triphosphate triphosphohydrolase [Phytophthora fragariae]KAE9089361.1 Deoxynucleoside triphosphate triphosphohydrolase [Phytophthora fragariae]